MFSVICHCAQASPSAPSAISATGAQGSCGRKRKAQEEMERVCHVMLLSVCKVSFGWSGAWAHAWSSF